MRYHCGMDEHTFAGLVLLILGGLQAVQPDLWLRFQVWIQKKVFGAQYTPSAHTRRVIRSMGVGVAILGILVLTGAIE